MATGHPFGKIVLLGGLLIGFVCLPSAEAALTRQNFNLPDLSRHMTGSPDDLRELLDTELQKNRELQFMKRAFPKEYRAFLDGLLNAGSRKKAERFIRTYLTRFFDDNLEMIMHAEQPFLLTLFADELAFRKRAAAESPRLCVRAIRDGEFPASEKIRHRLIPVASDEFLHLLQAMENGRKSRSPTIRYPMIRSDKLRLTMRTRSSPLSSPGFSRNPPDNTVTRISASFSLLSQMPSMTRMRIPRPVSSFMKLRRH